MTHYKNTQNGVLVTAILIIVFLVTAGAYIFQSGKTPLPLWAFIAITALFLLIALSFYKLTITINDDKIEAKFGIGLLKRSLKLNAINYDSIEEIDIPALYGIGIRITPHGILYNIKIGKAIKIKSNDKNFFVGTDDFSTIKGVLLELKSKKA